MWITQRQVAKKAVETSVNPSNMPIRYSREPSSVGNLGSMKAKSAVLATTPTASVPSGWPENGNHAVNAASQARGRANQAAIVA